MEDSNNTPENTNIDTSELTDKELIEAIRVELRQKKEALDRREQRLDEREEAFNNKELSLRRAVKHLGKEELHYLFFTMADIVKFLADSEAMYSDDNQAAGCLQGAISVEDMAKQELILRMEKQIHKESIESYKQTG